MKDGRTLLVRCDASVAIGTGHVMRCLALAQAWFDAGGRATFVMAESTPAVEERLRSERFELVRLTVEAGSPGDADETAALAGRCGGYWVVVDGYNFGADYQAALKDRGLRVLFIDDNGNAGPYSADLVLNQNAYAEEAVYSARNESTRLLLGPRYVLLRSEFKSWRGWVRQIPSVARRCLVTMGGSDPDNVTKLVIEAIRQLSIPDLETIVLVGGSNPHLDSVEASLQNGAMRVVAGSTNIPEIMAWADVAIAGAGTTFWEMCFFGLPAILLVLAENQKGIAAAGARMGTAWNMGKGTRVAQDALAERLADLVNSPRIRTIQSERGRKLVDGRGSERAVAFLLDFRLRRTVESDCRLFWEWANEPAARSASFRNKAISWEHHVQWFQAKLNDPSAILYTVTTTDDLPIGEMRYQVSGDRAVLSIGLGVRFRGCGWGRKVLALGIDKMFQDSAVQFIDAYVKPSNEASLRLFLGASFERHPPQIIEGQEAVHFVLRRNMAP